MTTKLYGFVNINPKSLCFECSNSLKQIQFDTVHAYTNKTLNKYWHAWKNEAWKRLFNKSYNRKTSNYWCIIMTGLEK